jgi:DNA-binding HxlR family transcriptional regulator
MTSRSYGQYCGLARSLDTIGDRWSLLIVRELLLGPLRYGELKTALDGIATNLLVNRLRDLEGSGVIERQVGDVGGLVYALTPWGAQLREAIESLVRWSTPLMISGQGSDAFSPRWLAVALPALLDGRTARRPTEVGIDLPGLFVTLRIDKDGPSVTAAPDQRPDTVLTAPPEIVLGLAAGALTLEQALPLARVHGDPGVLDVIFAPRTA